MMKKVFFLIFGIILSSCSLSSQKEHPEQNQEMSNLFFSEQKDYDHIFGVFFSPDKKTVILGVKKNDKVFFVKDGIEGEKYDNIDSPVFSDDGKHFAFIAKKNEEWLIVKDGVDQEKYNSEKYYAAKHLVMSFDGKNTAFVLEENETGSWFFVKNGIIINDFPSAYDFGHVPVFSPDGESLAFIVMQGDEGDEFIVQDNKRVTKNYPHILFLFFGPDGKTLFFTVNDGQGWTGKEFLSHVGEM